MSSSASIVDTDMELSNDQADNSLDESKVSSTQRQGDNRDQQHVAEDQQETAIEREEETRESPEAVSVEQRKDKELKEDTLPEAARRMASNKQDISHSNISGARILIQERTGRTQEGIHGLDNLSSAINSLDDHFQAKLQDVRDCVRQLDQGLAEHITLLEAKVQHTTAERDRYQLAVTHLQQELTSTREQLLIQQQKNERLIKRQQEIDKETESHLERVGRSAHSRRLATSALSRWRKKVRDSSQADIVGARLLVVENRQLREELLLCQEAAKQAFLRSANVLNSEAVTMFQDAATRRLGLDENSDHGSQSSDSSSDSSSIQNFPQHQRDSSPHLPQDTHQPHQHPSQPQQEPSQSHQDTPSHPHQPATRPHLDGNLHPRQDSQQAQDVDSADERRRSDRREWGRDDRGIPESRSFSGGGHRHHVRETSRQEGQGQYSRYSSATHRVPVHETDEGPYTYGFSHTYPMMDNDMGLPGKMRGAELPRYASGVPKRKPFISEFAPDSLRRETQEYLQQLHGNRLDGQERGNRQMFEPQQKTQRMMKSRPTSARTKSCTCKGSTKGNSLNPAVPYRCPYCTPIQASSFGHAKDPTAVPDGGRTKGRVKNDAVMGAGDKKKVIYKPSASTVVIERHFPK